MSIGEGIVIAASVLGGIWLLYFIVIMIILIWRA